MHLPVEWFDCEENSIGSILNKLSVDCNILKSLTTTNRGVQVVK